MRRPVLALLVLSLCLAVTGVVGAASAPSQVSKQLALAERSGLITSAEHASCLADYQQTAGAAKRLPAGPRRELLGVRGDVESLAARGLLAAAARAACLTLANNLQWFWTERLGPSAYGTRTLFGDSEVIWQAYPGQGWQIQPLGTFGALNALLKSKGGVPRAAALGDEMQALAASRGGALRDEYLFAFGNARPGWVSAMTAATAAQAYARLWQRTGVDGYRQAAASRLAPLAQRPPAGVRVDRGTGRAEYLLSSGEPATFVANGQAQTVIGLLDYAQITGDPSGQALADAGLREAETVFPAYDTGAWSLYSRTPTARGPESDLSYHRLLTGFLNQLCTKTGQPVFCSLAQRFVVYESQPIVLGMPKLAVKRGARTPATIQLSASKRGSLAVSLWRGQTRVRTLRLTTVSGGRRTLSLPRPSAGAYHVEVQATSLTGLTSAATGPTVTIPRR